MTEGKKKNLEQQIKNAESKIADINTNSAQLREKIQRLELQIKQNEEKKKKIIFFLEKTKETLSDPETSGTPKVPQGKE